MMKSRKKGWEKKKRRKCRSVKERRKQTNPDFAVWHFTKRPESIIIISLYSQLNNKSNNNWKLLGQREKKKKEKMAELLFNKSFHFSFFFFIAPSFDVIKNKCFRNLVKSPDWFQVHIICVSPVPRWQIFSQE